MTAKGKLAAEFVLIVVGVLIALAVDTAFKDREDDELRAEYVGRIQQDIETDRRALLNRIEFFSDVQRFCNEMLAWLDSDQPVDQEVLLASFYAAEVWPVVTNLSTYQDLLSTGNIRLLSDIDFRGSLFSYYNKADTSRPGWNPSQTYRETIRGIIPNDVQKLIRENCPTTDTLDEEPTGFPPCELPGVDYDALNQLYLPLKSDEAFRRTLTYRDSEIGVMLYLMTQQVAFADGVLQQTPH
jgi:hypothetical protein